MDAEEHLFARLAHRDGGEQLRHPHGLGEALVEPEIFGSERVEVVRPWRDDLKFSFSHVRLPLFRVKRGLIHARGGLVLAGFFHGREGGPQLRALSRRTMVTVKGMRWNRRGIASST